MRHLGYFWPNYKHYLGTVSPLSMGKCSWLPFLQKTLVFRSITYNSTKYSQNKIWAIKNFGNSVHTSVFRVVEEADIFIPESFNCLFSVTSFQLIDKCVFCILNKLVNVYQACPCLIILYLDFILNYFIQFYPDRIINYQTKTVLISVCKAPKMGNLQASVIYFLQ